MLDVHVRRGDPHHAHRSGGTLDLAGEGMRRMISVRTLARRIRRDKEPAAVDLDVVSRHGVGLVARLPLAGPAMVLPVMPGAGDILPIEPSLGERPARVIAHAGDGAELPVHPRHCHPRGTDAHAREWLSLQFLNGADIVPAGGFSHGGHGSGARGAMCALGCRDGSPPRGSAPPSDRNNTRPVTREPEDRLPFLPTHRVRSR